MNFFSVDAVGKKNKPRNKWDHGKKKKQYFRHGNLNGYVGRK